MNVSGVSIPLWLWACVLPCAVVGTIIGVLAESTLWGALTTLGLTIVISQVVLTLRQRRGKGVSKTGRPY